MGLLTIIRKARLKDRECRILMLGLDNAGKTTLVKRMKGEPIDEIAPTLGFNIVTFLHRGLTVNVWDVGGQRSLRGYWRNHFEATDALIWVVDSCDRLRLDDCKKELHSLLLEERLASASLLIFANKQDINGAMTYKEIIEGLDLPSVKSHAWLIQPCSAVTGLNLLKGLDAVIDEVGKRVYAATPPTAPVAPGLEADT